MKRSQMIEAIKQAYTIGVLYCESGLSNLTCDVLQETGEIILAGLMLDEVFGADDLVDDSNDPDPKQYSSSIQRIKRFLVLADEADAIRCRNMEWKSKYDLIFSDDISAEISKTGFELEYFDPDKGYKDDVNSYVEAVMEKANELKPMIGK